MPTGPWRPGRTPTHRGQRQSQPGPVQHQHQQHRDLQRDQLRPVERGERLQQRRAADPEYYAFGNPQPTFDADHQRPDQPVRPGGRGGLRPQRHQPLPVRPGDVDRHPEQRIPPERLVVQLRVLQRQRRLLHLQLQLEARTTTSDNANVSCGPVYFGPNDYLFGPVYTNDSVFVSPSPVLRHAGLPVHGDDGRPPLPVRRRQHQPGMNGNYTNCARGQRATSSTYDTTNSSYGHAVEQPPANDTQLGHHRRPERVPLLGPDPDHPLHRRQRERPDDRGQPGHLRGHHRRSTAPATPGTPTTSPPISTTAPTTAPPRSRPTGWSSSRTPPDALRPRPGPTRSTIPPTTPSPT